MDAERLQDLVLRFRECRVAVLGDFFLDKYLDVEPALEEVSLETGKAAHQVVSVRCSPGAAGTVVNNLAALQAGEIHALGFTGDDGEGYELRRALRRLGCDTRGLVSLPNRFTPTYLKPRDHGNPDLSGEHERYDTKNRVPAPTDAQERVLAHLAQLLPYIDATIVIDQADEADCGIVTGTVREGLARLAASSPGKVFWADSRRRIGLFRDMIVKVNAREAVREVFGEEQGSGSRDRGSGSGDRGSGDRAARIGDAEPGADAADEDEVVRRAMSELARRTGKPVFVTAGRRGIWVSHPEPTLVRAVRVEGPIDPTGAGDGATAGAVLALCAGATMSEAALVANLVASITIQQLATTGTAMPSQLGPRLEMWRSQA